MSDSHQLAVVLGHLRDARALADRRAGDGHTETAAHYAWERDRLDQQIAAMVRAFGLADTIEHIDRINAREGYRRLYEVHYEREAYSVGVDSESYGSLREVLTRGLDQRPTLGRPSR